MANAVFSSAPNMPTIRSPNNTHDQTSETRKTMHKNLITKLRPLPFQYVWTVHYDKSASAPPPSCTTTTTATSTNPSSYTSRLSLLSASVPTIAEFYKIFNNIPWSAIPPRDSIHIFRSGVQPLWEDPANLEGGCWTLKVRKQASQSDRPRRVWEEMCLMGCGGELQAALVEAGSRDAVLGMSFSPRGMWVSVSVWLKGVRGVVTKGEEERSREGWQVVQRTVLERLSPELRPESEREYFWKRHCEHDGWEEAVGRGK